MSDHASDGGRGHQSARIRRSSSSVHNQISRESSWLVRRLAATLIGIWFGGILLVALAAPASFRSVDAVLASPPPAVEKAVEQMGPRTVHDILYYQVSEANRQIFESWGWVQLALGGVIFLMLLFLSTVGKTQIGISLCMFLLSLLMQFVLIPRISELGRLMRRGAQMQPGQLEERFRLLHLGFTTFELTVVVLGTILLLLLLRSRSAASLARREALASSLRDDA